MYWRCLLYYLFTNVADYKITGDEESKIRALHAATILAGRYYPKGQFIRAWYDNPYIDGDVSKAGYVIIDCMMNIPLIYGDYFMLEALIRLNGGDVLFY